MNGFHVIIKVQSRQNADIALRLKRKDKKIVSHIRNNIYMETKIERAVIGR